MADGFEDPYEGLITRKKMIKRPDWLAVGVSVVSIVTTLGAWAWWGGKLSQRVETLEAVQQRQEERLNEYSRDNTKQDIALGVTGQQYADIIRRLGEIDRKLDKR
jgi:cell division protein FtsB